MCVIAISEKGVRQPNENEFRTMWEHNPHGAGYMFARNGKVEIHKGFMCFDDFIRSVHNEMFTFQDSVIYHFRISTQAGITPEMTHPFPITNQNINIMKALDVICNIGVAHNGIIPLTASLHEKEYSDTALFVHKYLSNLVRSPADMQNENIKSMIKELAQSKLAMMDGQGNISTIGDFFDEDGILLSNKNHLFRYLFSTERSVKNVLCPQWSSVRYGV